MPLKLLSITMDEALAIAEGIILKAAADGGSPVAVAITDAAGKLKYFVAMDNVTPASIKLAQSKAYSAVVGQRDTINWASFPKNEKYVDFDMRNWTDENFSGFTGGVIIKYEGQVIGGIGISGRKGVMNEGDVVFQDNELAHYGNTIFNNLTA
jgi:uncharacterized protein GlcG (DUF336 family)